MNRRRNIIAICALCALAVGVIATQSASASNGTTAFTCVPTEGGAGFSREHCRAADVVSEGAKFKDAAIAEGTTTELTGTSVDTSGNPIVSKLKSTQAGVNEEFQSALAHVLPEHNAEKSWLTNAKDPLTGQHYVHGELWLQYTEVEVTAPAGKGCKVKGGQITTNKLKITSKGQGDELLFQPASGSVLAEYEIEGCSKEALNGVYKAEGSFKAPPEGSTHASVTAQGTLKLRGQKAGLEAQLTLRATDEEDPEGSDKPVSVTTVETP